MKISHPNRPNARKKKQGGGCGLCKPHKKGYEPNFNAKTLGKIKAAEKEIKEF